METVQLLILALIQGVTEFLPISSAAHLILPSVLLGWQDQGLAFDTCVHLASLLAVLIYFRSDLARLAVAGWRALQGQTSADGRLLGALALASLPIIPAGYYGRFLIETELRTGLVIATTTLGFGLALLLADTLGKKQLGSEGLTPGKALLIGCAQCLALVPGTSRSGITMTAALLAGFTREAAVRISFLLAIPAIAGAALLKLWDMTNVNLASVNPANANLASADQAVTPVTSGGLLLAFVVSGVAAYCCIRLLVGLVSRVGFWPFVLYRLALGGYLFWVFA